MRFVLAIALMFIVTATVHAHKLLLELQLTSDQIRLVAFFEDDSPADDAIVQLMNDREEIVQETKTDGKGIALLKRPLPGNYRIKLDAIGHIVQRDLLIPGIQTIEPTIQGPTREEQTKTPWDRIGLGIGIILGATIGWYFFRRKPVRS